MEKAIKPLWAKLCLLQENLGDGEGEGECGEGGVNRGAGKVSMVGGCSHYGSHGGRWEQQGVEEGGWTAIMAVPQPEPEQL